MNDYEFKGTVYVTTGYIDRTWEKDPTWLTTDVPLSVSNIKELHESGWEIGLHGDTHITDLNDTYVSHKKISNWLGVDMRYGFSMPNSRADENELQKISELVRSGGEIKYIRKGRRCNTSSLKSKIMFVGYSVLGSQFAYNSFNKRNIEHMDRMDPTDIRSLVVRENDSPEMIVRFIDKIPNNTVTVLMLHGIMPHSHPLYKKDPWCFSDTKFKKLCSLLSDRVKKNQVRVMPLSDILDEAEKPHNVITLQA